MKDEEIDGLIHKALTSREGKLFHSWLVNNYLMSPKATLDPHQALVMNAQQVLVTEINKRYARHEAKAYGRSTEPGKPRRPRTGRRKPAEEA